MTKERMGALSAILSTEDIIPKQGFAAPWFGRRTRSLGTGGNRGAAETALEAALAGIVLPLRSQMIRKAC